MVANFTYLYLSNTNNFLTDLSDLLIVPLQVLPVQIRLYLEVMSMMKLLCTFQNSNTGTSSLSDVIPKSLLLMGVLLLCRGYSQRILNPAKSFILITFTRKCNCLRRINILLRESFFTLTLADGFPVEFEWQQIYPSLQDSSQYSRMILILL